MIHVPASRRSTGSLRWQCPTSPQRSADTQAGHGVRARAPRCACQLPPLQCGDCDCRLPSAGGCLPTADCATADYDGRPPPAARLLLPDLRALPIAAHVCAAPPLFDLAALPSEVKDILLGWLAFEALPENVFQAVDMHSVHALGKQKRSQARKWLRAKRKEFCKTYAALRCVSRDLQSFPSERTCGE